MLAVLSILARRGRRVIEPACIDRDLIPVNDPALERIGAPKRRARWRGRRRGRRLVTMRSERFGGMADRRLRKRGSGG